MRTASLLLIVCAVAAADVVVLNDETVLDGTVAKDGDKLTVAGRTVPLSDVLLWENADGVVQHAADSRAHYGGCVVLAEREVLKACVERLAKAVSANDVETARQLLQRAERAGLEAKDAESWDAKIDKLADGGAKSGVEVPRNKVLVEMLLDRARKHMEADSQRGLYLLRGALHHDSKHKASNEYLEELAPKRWKIGDKRNWLEWKLDVLPGVRLHTSTRRSSDLARARTFWGRKDLVALETNDMIFVTPLKNTAPVSMCLELGALTCAALDKMFAVEEPRRDEFLPLLVYFYENKKEYVERSNRGMGGGPSGMLGLTAGHYTPRENISRFFWPAHGNAFKSVRDTFVHELTHHWIERRNPRWHEREMADSNQRVQVPGYWVVEGFATFIQHSRFDRKRKTWTHFNPHAHSIDVVAAVSKERNEKKEKRLLKWDMVYTMNQATFHGTLSKTAAKMQSMVKGRWSYRPHPISAIRLFYEQSSATCMFLYWGENGKYRQQLIEYVTAFYTSQKEKTDLNAAFGLTPEQLGAKVERFCLAVIDEGYRPDRK